MAATRALIISSEAPIRLIARVNLELEGINVAEAEDGQSGLEYAVREQPDVIFLDASVTDADGRPVLDQLRAHPATRGVRIELLTTSAS